MPALNPYQLCGLIEIAALFALVAVALIRRG